MVEMQLEDVLVRVTADDPPRLVWHGRIVLLKEKERGRLLPIWAGAPEGDMLVMGLRGFAPPRPMTHDLAVELVRVSGAHIGRVTITSRGRRDNTFYATVAVAVDGRVEEVDARPSDAINLAVRVGAPILAADDFVDQHAFEPDDLPARLEREFETRAELPPSEWASVSAERFRGLQWPPSP